MRRLILSTALLLWAGAASAQTPPLRTGIDGTFAPHAMPKLGGGVEGFNVDLFTEVARRMGREITIEPGTFTALVPALNSGRLDFLSAPTTVTRERAEMWLFTEGYLWTAFQFGIRKGTAPITALSDLKGKAITVNKGSAYEAWARDNADKLGFTYQVFETNTDAVAAVVSGRAYANLAGNTVVRYAATRTPNFVPDFVIKETRAHWAAPFRKDSAALRNQVEDALECMKKDGTIAKLSEKWFGVTPAADDLENTVVPGYGVPDMPGYDPTPHEPRCG